MSILFVWILTTTFYCADQIGEFACPPPVTADDVLASTIGPRIAHERLEGYFASADGCEAAAAKERNDQRQVVEYLRSKNIKDYLRGGEVACERQHVKP
jgi:hypothetical protein